MNRFRSMAVAAAGVLLLGAADDPHVALRDRLGLPRASAHGDLRVYVGCDQPGANESSLVANRRPGGLWSFSKAEVYGGGKDDRRSLSRAASRALDRRLADPALYAEADTRESGFCAHACFVTLETTRPRPALVEHVETCESGAPPAMAGLLSLLEP